MFDEGPLVDWGKDRPIPGYNLHAEPLPLSMALQLYDMQTYPAYQPNVVSPQQGGAALGDPRTFRGYDNLAPDMPVRSAATIRARLEELYKQSLRDRGKWEALSSQYTSTPYKYSYK